MILMGRKTTQYTLWQKGFFNNNLLSAVVEDLNETSNGLHLLRPQPLVLLVPQ